MAVSVLQQYLLKNAVPAGITNTLMFNWISQFSYSITTKEWVFVCIEFVINNYGMNIGLIDGITDTLRLAHGVTMSLIGGIKI